MLETSDHFQPLQNVSLDRMVRAVELVCDRLKRAAAALDTGDVPYAVVEDNAVAAWVSRVDETAVRNTQDVDILLRRGDLEAAKVALGAAGFVYRHVKSIDMFLDGPDAKARDAVHVVFAHELVKADSLAPSPGVEEFDDSGNFRVLQLESLVRMKLTPYRDKDRVHLRDMIEIGLIDETWPTRFEPPLGERLQALLDDPEG
jgi:ethanolamine ammonia-lyase small subunit